MLLLGISWAWGKQTAWILQNGGKSNMNVPVSVPLGENWTFLLRRLISGSTHTLPCMCVSTKAKGKQQMCLDYWITQWDVPSNTESNYFVLHSGFKLREKKNHTSFILIWLLSVLKWKFKAWTFPSLSFTLWRKRLLTHPRGFCWSLMSATQNIH